MADESIRFDCARSRIMTQQKADDLWDIACVAKALVRDPPWQDAERIRNCLRNMFANAEKRAKGLGFVPEAGFDWRIK